MAQRAAVANGNWSSTSTWNGGVLPSAGDIVASNGFTVTIDVNVNVDSITNAATTVTTAVPIMTSNTAPSGIASNSGTTGWNPAYTAFNGDVSNTTFAGNTVVGEFVAYEFTSPKKIGQFSIRYNGGSFSINYSLDGWDGTTWTTIGTHNTTGGANTSPAFSNPTAYIKYRIQFLTAGVYTQINEIYMFEALSVAATAGGTFNLNSEVTVTCTGFNGIYAGNVTCLTYLGTGTSTINGNILPLQVSPGTYTYCLVHNGTGILNINGNLYVSSECSNRGCLTLTGSGTLNVVGSLFGAAGFCSTPGVSVTASGRFNIIGDIYGGGNVTALDLSGTSVTTVTGNLYGGSNSGRAIVISSTALLTVTGSLLYGGNGGPCININSGTPNVTITGNVGSAFGNSTTLLASAAGSYIKVVGTIFAGLNYNFYSASPSAINILTGPFISYATGVHPFWVTRMHYQRTFGSYLEFRDSSTGGALPPVASAPATRLVSPDTVVAAPIPANVRQGTVYALGSQTGTMIVPNPANVVKNVPVDNTVGTAVLEPGALWAVPLSAINTSNSIGQRVKNASTVESTGAQIQTTLNNNP